MIPLTSKLKTRILCCLLFIASRQYIPEHSKPVQAMIEETEAEDSQPIFSIGWFHIANL